MQIEKRTKHVEKTSTMGNILTRLPLEELWNYTPARELTASSKEN
jgi:hypothetical protein